MEASDAVDNTDVFNSLTESQKKAVQDYYMWYTVEVYQGLTKNKRLEVSEIKF